ncbi:undecaprenyl-phosphate 4-deoxy-4-formamido-L-arabinose transferase [bacterium BMS3Abin15]|nr:undecaprenyl-phosphate 4-deoxy-4-formamido-L-arabinose transferase [bacterium BMS3Abin15]
MNNQVRYSVVIPVYNSETTLEKLFERLLTALKTVPEDFEVIFVDDGSSDGSWQKLKDLRTKDNKIKIIQLMRNFGQHNALICGFYFAKGKYIITMDDDLQNPPEEIPKLISKIGEGYDIVYGKYISKKHSGFRNLGSLLIQCVYKKVFNVQNMLSSFRIIRGQLIHSILKYEKSYVFIDGLLAWNTRNIGYVQVEHHERTVSKSGYRFKKLLTLSLNMITNFSILPLQISSIMGLLFALLGFMTAGYFLLKKIIYGIPVEGYTSLIIAITIFAGIQLLTIGLIGEYIGRIHLNINNKPQYEIREQIL